VGSSPTALTQYIEPYAISVGAEFTEAAAFCVHPFQPRGGMRDHQDEWRTAVHEAGHAVAAALGNVPIRSVTVAGGDWRAGKSRSEDPTPPGFLARCNEPNQLRVKSWEVRSHRGRGPGECAVGGCPG
jgi:hypothetical protein